MTKRSLKSRVERLEDETTFSTEDLMLRSLKRYHGAIDDPIPDEKSQERWNRAWEHQRSQRGPK